MAELSAADRALLQQAQQQEAGTLGMFLKKQYKFSITKPELLKETEE